MKKTTFMVGLVLAVSIIGISEESAKALTIEQTVNIERSQTVAMADKVVSASVNNTKQIEETAKKPPKHKVKKGETLSSIAKAHDTSWVRLFNKNTHIEDPNVISVDMDVTIPDADEKLANRPLPATPAAPAPRDTVSTERTSQPASPRRRTVSQPSQNQRPAQVRRTQTRGSSAGNLYTPGYCTWYVKNRRPDLPNNLGNANTWVSRARAQGLATGSSPRVGAVGQQGMHVVYVEAVNSNGTVTVSEMNFKGLYTISRRTVPASSFQYIY